MKLRHRVLWSIVIVVGLAIISLAILLSYNAPCDRPAPIAMSTPAMQAVMARCYGSPETLAVESTPIPTPSADEVLVKVHAAALNPLDWHMVRGEPRIMRLAAGFGAPKDGRVGVDFAGTVATVGANVSKFKPGDEVFGGADGAVAEFLVVNQNKGIVHKPTNMSFAQAATIGVAGVSALQGLRDAGQLQRGQRVLINGASGGVGTLAVQIAKAMGAEVTAVCSTRNVDLVRSLGADHVVDYTQADFTAGDAQYDLILDMASTQPISAMRRVMTPTGRLVIVGGVSREPWLGPLTTWIKASLYDPFVDQTLMKFLASLRQNDLQAIAEWMRTGAVTPVIDRHFGLNDVAAALAYVESGRARGKVVVDVIAPESMTSNQLIK